MTHIVLLGDSILDNAAYVPRRQAVIDHLHANLPHGWKATLLAVDGSTSDGVPRQLARLPADATHLVVSAGGNDALGRQDILSRRASSAADVLLMLAGVVEAFERDYRAMLDAVNRPGLPVVLCTIYYPRFPDAQFQRLAVTASAHFNDVILRAAFGAGAPVLDLRFITDDDADFANAIEPSSAGGRKVAQAVLRAVTEHDFHRGRSEVFV